MSFIAAWGILLMAFFALIALGLTAVSIAQGEPWWATLALFVPSWWMAGATVETVRLRYRRGRRHADHA